MSGAVTHSGFHLNETQNLSTTIAPVREVNVFNQTVPDSDRYNYEWLAYGIFLIIWTIYSMGLAFHIFKTIYDSQNGFVGKCRGSLAGLVVIILLIGIGLAARWLTICSSNPILIFAVLVVDVVTCLIELLVLCVKSALSASATVCNLLFLMTMDVIEIIILALMLQEIKSWCNGLASKEGTVCHPWLETF